MPKEERRQSTYVELMANTFKLVRWSGHWFPITDSRNGTFLSVDLFRSCFFIVTIPLQMIPCIIDLVLKIPDMPKVIMNAISTIYSIHALFRVIFTIVMRKNIWNIFKQFEKCKVPPSFRQLDRQLGQDVTQKAFKSANKIFLIIIIGANVTGCLFTVTPFVISYEARIQKIQKSSINASLIPNVLVYEAWYPFDISHFPAYQLTLLFQAFCGFIWINMISTSDAMYLSIVIRAAEEFNVLKDMLVTLSNMKSSSAKTQTLINDGARRTISNFEWPKDANILLKSWTEYHQLVLCILTEIKNTFSVFVFGVVGCNAVSLVLLAYIGATIKDLTALLSILSFVFVVIAQLLSFSYYSVKLTSKSDEMSEQLLSITWWEAPASYQTSLKLICLRASDRVTMSGMGYFDLNLELFLAIVKSALSYFMILINLTSEESQLDNPEIKTS